MHDVKMQLFEAAMATFDAYTGEFGQAHLEAGLNEDEWNIFTIDRQWASRDEHKKASQCLEQMISAGLAKAGIGAIQLPAEYVARAVSFFVDGRNWLSASAFHHLYYDGTQALTEGTPESRIHVPPEYYFLLIQQSWKNNSSYRRGPQELAETQMIEVENGAQTAKSKRS